MTGYRIEKNRCRVRVTTMSGETVSGEIFLQQFAVHHSGPETPLDILNSGDAFFPVTLDGGETRLLSTSGLADVRWPMNEKSNGDRASISHVSSLEVRLVNGATYRGTMLMEVPTRHARILDFLNFHSERFLTLSSDGDNLSINREMVESIRPLD
jgi:hypothetical protein